MPALYPPVVYLNGNWVEPENATISVFDRGFLFGDGVYEVVSFYNGCPFLLMEHLERLSISLRLSNLAFETAGLEKLITECITRTGLEDQHALVYLQITRGVAPRTHIYPAATNPTLMMYAKPHPLGQALDKHVTVWLEEDLRWHRCNIKTISLMGNVQASETAEKAGAFECLLHRNGKITEASHSNFFGVIDGVLRTHPADEYILHGIIRAKVIGIARQLHIPVEEKALTIGELENLEEAFLTGTGTELTSVKHIESAEGVHASIPGAGMLTHRLQQAFRKVTGI